MHCRPVEVRQPRWPITKRITYVSRMAMTSAESAVLESEQSLHRYPAELAAQHGSAIRTARSSDTIPEYMRPCGDVNPTVSVVRETDAELVVDGSLSSGSALASELPGPGRRRGGLSRGRSIETARASGARRPRRRHPRGRSQHRAGEPGPGPGVTRLLRRRLRGAAEHGVDFLDLRRAVVNEVLGIGPCIVDEHRHRASQSARVSLADAVQHAVTRSHVRDVRGGEPVRVVTRHGDKCKAATALR
jgi:hypothetical protein